MATGTHQRHEGAIQTRETLLAMGSRVSTQGQHLDACSVAQPRRYVTRAAIANKRFRRAAYCWPATRTRGAWIFSPALTGGHGAEKCRRIRSLACLTRSGNWWRRTRDDARESCKLSDITTCKIRIAISRQTYPWSPRECRNLLAPSDVSSLTSGHLARQLRSLRVLDDGLNVQRRRQAGHAVSRPRGYGFCIWAFGALGFGLAGCTYTGRFDTDGVSGSIPANPNLFSDMATKEPA